LTETGEEVPYASAVVIEAYEEPEVKPEGTANKKKNAQPARLPLRGLRRRSTASGTAEGNFDWQGRIEAQRDWHDGAAED